MSTFNQFADCLFHVLEGIESDSPIDPGGHTVWGFAGKTRERLGLPDDMDRQQAGAALKTHWWNKYGCDRMPPAVAWAVCDAFFNHSPRSAAIIVQRALPGVRVDGKYGPLTRVACVNVKDVKGFLTHYAFYRRQHFAKRSVSLFDKYKNDKENFELVAEQEHGWQNRIDRLLSAMWEAGILAKAPSPRTQTAAVGGAGLVAGAATAVLTSATDSSTVVELGTKAIEMAANGNLTVTGVATMAAGWAANKIVKGETDIVGWFKKRFKR